MPNPRIPIPDELAAQVMFASDRTCCVCRMEKLKVQIHHIDGDPSNNVFDNLAVICLHCHSDAHTNGAFVRNLTPELIRLYNLSWREIVKVRLMPSVDGAGKMELAAESFLEASLDCHSWKVGFMSLIAPNIPESQPGQFVDVWDAMAELWIPEYSEETYRRFLPLFDDAIVRVQQRFDRLIQLFPDILPHEFRAVLVRANRQLGVNRSAYAYVELTPHLAVGSPFAQRNAFFHSEFVEVIHVLRDVSREADLRRATLMEASVGS